MDRSAQLRRECERIRVIDPWLAGEVETHIRRASIYELAVGAGLIARYRTPSTRKERQEIFEQLLRGELPPQLMQDRAWAKQLSSEELDQLASLAREAGVMIYEDLVQLASDAVNRNLMKKVALARDDLQGVFTLLHHARPDQALVDQLRLLDELGRQVMQEVGEFRVESEQLFRAVCANPEGWWTIPGRV